MKKSIFTALLSLVAIVGVAFASLPLTRPTIMVNPTEMVVRPNMPFTITAAFTNTNRFIVFMNDPTASGYEVVLTDDMKNCPDMQMIECTFVTTETVLLWFYVYSIDESVYSFDCTFCRVEPSDI